MLESSKIRFQGCWNIIFEDSGGIGIFLLKIPGYEKLLFEVSDGVKKTPAILDFVFKKCGYTGICFLKIPAILEFVS